MKHLIAVCLVILAVSQGVCKPILRIDESEGVKITNEIIKGSERVVEVDTVEVDAMSEEDFNLLCRVVAGESLNQGYTGQRLVCAVILNRIDSDKFKGQTVKEIVYEKGQFQSVWDGGINRLAPNEETIQACKDEIRDRKYKKYLWFRTGRGHKAGAYKYKDHYFN